ncbi:hypothetical protein TVAG_191690 [Trichomonas vaginalis G3]|uniref:Uncharacterized protein n=1 Tax=Trichomonas vaginalis (strain ATCC PRA-98 / G3) TaxID=412133 RepID=A2EQM5_TRIV3|nr:hypothetical protein TVAGG3_0976880 [Trichomonas vaginalis G3]EAY05072.1 hypothetical protein TVAG_191690 [Trichomonas vaginalis G3]KAI5489004.1 hypothetical protein TVAGG3_0976880 [Trichomonas vaginalis G3]|eukprot:XP_001317295.1 hypothetical protein [Trichomonas vaginalis G3]
MNDIFGSPPKLNNDDREIKEAIKSSRTALRETTQNVNAREANIQITAESINQMYKRVDEWEKRLAEYADKALLKQSNLRKEQDKFYSENNHANTELDNQINELEEILNKLMNRQQEITLNLKFIEKQKKDFDQNIVELTQNVNNVSKTGTEHSKSITKASEEHQEFEDMQQHAIIEISENKKKISDLELEISQVQATLSDFKLKDAQNTAENTKLSYKIENLKEKRNNLINKYQENVNSLTNSINKKNENEFDPKTQRISLQNQIKSIKDSMTGIIKSISEKNSDEKIMRSNILREKANSDALRANIKNINSQIDKIKEDHNRFLDNVVKIRSIKVATISEIKTALFDVNNSIRQAQMSLDEMANMESRIAQRLRSTDVKIECCRANMDQIATNEIELQRLRLVNESREDSQTARVVALQDTLDALTNRIKGAEIEEQRLNRNFISLVSSRNPEPETKTDVLYSAVRRIKRENKCLVQQIQDVYQKINDLSFNQKKISGKIKQSRELSQLPSSKAPNPKGLCMKQHEISNLITKICEKKESIEYSRRKLANKQQNSYYKPTYYDYNFNNFDYNYTKSLFNERLTLTDLIWAMQSETYVWRSENTVFAKELLLNTWNHQLDLFNFK